MRNILSLFILIFVLLFLGVKSVSAQTDPSIGTDTDITTNSEEVVPESGGAIDQPPVRMDIPNTMATTNTTSTALTPEQIRVVQRELNVEGYTLVEDGVMNRETEAALRDYQRRYDLSETGTVDEETLSRLGLEEEFEFDTEAERSPASIDQIETPSVTQPDRTTR